MLFKVLGIITAGVFVGAAVIEISGYLARHRTGKGHGQKTPPAAVDPGVEAAKGHNKTAPQNES